MPPEPDPREPALVFATFDIAAGKWGAGVARADGSQSRALPLPLENTGGDPPDIAIRQVRWSPDGGRIVYAASFTGNDNWYLVLTDVAGTFKRLLTHRGGYMEDAQWSPAGDRLLYHWGGFVGGRGGQVIQTAIVDTLGQARDFFIPDDGGLFEGERVHFGLLPWPDSSAPLPALYDASWAPDGIHLYVVGSIGRRAWDPELRAEEVELFLVSAATGEVIDRVTRNDVPEWSARISPDGTRVLVPIWPDTWAEHPAGGAFVMPLQGQAADLRVVLEPFSLLDLPAWSTDGAYLTFTRPIGEGGYPRIFSYHPATGTERVTAASGFWPHLYRRPQF
ncbi:MAG TPA: hypothetical protein VK933_15615 [Longimicrobiales bacterium]|nr:hypothetical protein [Longimicrobiales bacterium]